jgi:hypothetical protein
MKEEEGGGAIGTGMHAAGHEQAGVSSWRHRAPGLVVSRCAGGAK